MFYVYNDTCSEPNTEIHSHIQLRQRYYTSSLNSGILHVHTYSAIAFTK